MLKANILKITLLSCILFFSSVQTHAQFGGNPPSVKWKQVNMPAARVIFPYGMDSVGLRVASIIAQMNGAVQPTIGFKQRQVSILLQNQTIISNGYVQLAPFKSEFYLTPEQNSFELGSLPWPEQLAIHEFRHVQQYNNFNVGLSRMVRFFFGDGGQLIANEVAIPDWFFEGDAVFNETHVSDQGRGRLPFYFNGYRGIWEAGKDYSWMKLRNGSYVDYVPDWYPTGYMLVAYGREKYGPAFWRNVTHDAAAYNSLFYPLHAAIKHYAGINFSRFRNDGLNYFKKQIALSANEVVGPKFKKGQHFIADVEYPAVVNDSTLIYTKTSYSKRTAFYVKTGADERRIAVRDISLDNYFDYKNGKLVYAAYKPDLRWGYRNYNDLKIIDVGTGEQRYITSKSKYFSPAFNYNGKLIVAVRVDEKGKSTLHILDAENGKVVSVVPADGSLFYTYPKFYSADKLVAAVRNPKGKMTIAVIDIKTGKPDNLLPQNIAPVGFTAIQKDTVYFTATTGKNDRLYALSIPDKKLFILKNDTLQNAIGNYEPSVAGNKLAWVSFTAYGYQVHQGYKSAITWLPEGEGYRTLSEYNISALKKDSAAALLDKINTQPIAITNYSKAHHLFNFHSLVPDFNDPNYTISLQGENVLNTFESAIYGNYNRNEGYKEVGYNAIYGGLFPYLEGGIDARFDRRGYFQGENIYWNDYQAYGGLSVPFNLGSGSHTTFLTIGTDLFYNSTKFQEAFRSRFRDEAYGYLSNTITFSNRIQQPVQNIYPHLAQNVTLRFKKGIINQTAYQFLGTGNFYFPGLFTNHNLVFGLAHQQESSGSIINFSNDFPFSRGYTVYNLNKMDKIAANYHFPIAYPDAGFGNLVYLLRLRGNLYFDYTRAHDFYTNGQPFTGDFRSTGGELFFDNQLFNELPFSIGLRYTRLLDTDLGGRGNNRFEIVLPLTLF